MANIMLKMPFLTQILAMMVAKLTAQLWSSPSNTDPSFIASFGIGSHSSAETLTVPTSVTSTRVSHARIKVWTRVNLWKQIMFMIFSLLERHKCCLLSVVAIVEIIEEGIDRYMVDGWSDKQAMSV